jgi:hypothetical protein
MKTVVREIASLVVGLTGVVLTARGLNGALDIGSCASGGPYAITRPCPEGADMVFWMLAAGMVLWVVGMLVSKRVFVEPGAGQFLWVAGFAGGGGAVLVKVLTDPSMMPDARLGASIVAAVFIPMGLAVGIVGVVQLVRKRRGGGTARRRSQNTRRHGTTSAPSDAWSRLKALNDLRSIGALTRAEFDALKADLAAREPDGPWEPTMERIAAIRQLAGQRTSGALSTAAFEARKRGVLLGQPTDPPRR